MFAFQQCQAWTTTNPNYNGARFTRYQYSSSSRPTTLLFSSDSNTGVDSFSLAGVDNHHEEGQKMAESIARWLDSEVCSEV